MNDRTARMTLLSRKEWTLVALGVAVWIALAAGGVWFAHQVTRQREACGNPAEAPTRQVKGAAATAPANARQSAARRRVEASEGCMVPILSASGRLCSTRPPCRCPPVRERGFGNTRAAR